MLCFSFLKMLAALFTPETRLKSSYFSPLSSDLLSLFSSSISDVLSLCLCTGLFCHNRLVPDCLCELILLCSALVSFSQGQNQNLLFSPAFQQMPCRLSEAFKTSSEQQRTVTFNSVLWILLLNSLKICSERENLIMHSNLFI